MNALVVDDDIMAVKGMIARVEWEKLGVDRVFGAYSKKQAMEVIGREPVEVMLCDIEMPQGNGYELVEWMEENGYGASTVFITSYARFDYITKAIGVQAVDYLLKPVSRAKLETTVKKAVHHAQMERQKKQNEWLAQRFLSSRESLAKEFWRSLIQSEHSSPDYLRALGGKYAMELRRGAAYYPMLVYYRTEGRGTSSWSSPSANFALENIAAETLFGKTESGNILTLEGEGILILYETETETNGMLAQRCQGLLRRWKHYLHHFDIGICVKERMELGQVAQAVRELRRWRQSRPVFEEGVHVVSEVTVRKEQDSAEAVRLTREYLRLHMAEEIGRKEAAEHVHLNPDYLSRIFKEETGLSIMDYMLELRMREAKRLLLQTNQTIGEISSQVGYGDASYFTRMFSRSVGLSPREYRKQRGWRTDE